MNDMRMAQQGLHVAIDAVQNRRELTDDDWVELHLLLLKAVGPLDEALGYVPVPDTDWRHL